MAREAVAVNVNYFGILRLIYTMLVNPRNLAVLSVEKSEVHPSSRAETQLSENQLSS